METAGSREARKAFNRMRGNRRTLPPGVHTKGKTADRSRQNGMGHRAPSTTNGNGRRRPAQATRTNRGGFPIGHKAPSTTQGSGKRVKSKRNRQNS